MSDAPRHVVAITASGPVGCGKSVVLGEIEIALKAIGLDVVWAGGDQEKRLTHADWQHDLDMYQPRVVLTEIVNGNCDCPNGWEKHCALASCSRETDPPDFGAALRDCVAAMREAHFQGCVDHLDCCDDGGAFWHEALDSAENLLRRAGRLER